MNRIGHLFSGVLVLACCLTGMAVSSCVKEKHEEDAKPKTQLQAPAPRLEAVGFNTATLSWQPVSGATSYNVYFEGDEYPEISIDTFIVIKGLAPQTDYKVAMTAVPASQSDFAESEKSSAVSFKTQAKPRLESPKISVKNITTTGFEASWSEVEMAGSYTVILSDKAQSDTLSIVGDTLRTWTGLVPGTDYSLSIVAVPAEDYELDWYESEPSVCAVATPLPGQLAAPAVKVEKATIVEAVLSWDEVEEASSYQWFIDDSKDTTSTTGLSAKVTGLEEGSEHVFHVRSVSDDQNVHTDSEWKNVNFTVTVRTPLATPVAKYGEIGKTGFSVVWDKVDDAGSYKYKLADGEVATTTELTCSFSELQPSTSYKAMVCAVPSDAESEYHIESQWAEVEVETAAPGPMDAPVLTIDRASCYVSTISWVADPDALMYEWKMDTEEVNQTTETSVSFENLEKDSHHVLSVRSISSNTKVATDSDWATVEFDAVDDFVSTLTLSDAEISGDYAKFLATVASGEQYYMGFALKGKYLKDDGQVDSTALVSEVLAALSDKADGLVADGTYSTKKAALASLVRNKSTRLQSATLYHSAQYLCYAFDVNVLNCTAMSDLKYLEVTTGEHVSALGSYSSSALMTVSTNLAYGYSSSTGVYDDTNYAGFSIATDNSNVSCTEVKYVMLTLAAYNSSIGSSFDSSVEGAVKAYFNASGSTMSETNLTKLNDGTSYASGYTKRSANATYVVMARAVTAASDTLVAVSAVKTCASSCNWLTITGENPGKFTITSDLPITGGKYSCVTLSTSNNQPQLLDTYMETRGTALSDARVAAINGDGATISYSSLTSGKTYMMIVQVTSITGETITRACPLRVE